jgi:predicted ATPase
LSTFHYVRAEYQEARELGEEALNLAQQIGDPLLVMLGHWYLGYTCFGLGEFIMTRAHLEQVISCYEPQQHHHSMVRLRGSDAGVGALAYNACCLWCLGYPEQAAKQSQAALALARELGHPHSSADVLTYGGCVFNQMRRDASALKDNAEELTRLSRDANFPLWAEIGICLRGAALIGLGHVQEGIAQMREGLAVRQSLDERCHISGISGALAEALAKAGQPESGLAILSETLAQVQETDERSYEAELYRLRGELLLMQGDQAEAEASLHKALEVARRQALAQLCDSFLDVSHLD